MDLDYDPALVEAAVLAGAGDDPAFRGERDALYDVADAEAREAAFVALHARWFHRLGLDRPLAQALAERPRIPAECGRGVVARAAAATAEAADLLVAPPEPPTLLVRCTPERLASPGNALPFLRRELLHVADMLDPAFGYEPRLPPAGPHVPAGRHLERYRVLWDAYVDGRLAAEGRGAPAARRTRLREFELAFPELGGAAAAAFARFFDAAGCTHRQLVAFASSSEGPIDREASVAVR